MGVEAGRPTDVVQRMGQIRQNAKLERVLRWLVHDIQHQQYWVLPNEPVQGCHKAQLLRDIILHFWPWCDRDQNGLEERSTERL